ncbi:PepSY domain-containing protein [Pseudohalioglobus lutimaris]|uniref:Peptidase M4 n=1 Tax=Pseudohalioglobus lutimaris TaxID=1737061 RepID=A0A2N5X530_9GAMM|nr:PepSY domain-containing protein [Pseudohalioglobus lutimaris]PLW69594.1 peptidase M4 [Pseudohalioglobus lutimaris]
MITRIKNVSLFSIAAFTLAFSGLTMADQDEVRAIAGAKITLVEAIQHAQSAHEGTAIEAGIDEDSFKPEFEVTLVRDGVVYDVRVSAETGEVLGVREDKN